MAVCRSSTGLHLGRLVRDVVVEHEMDVASSHRPVDAAQEGQKLPGAVAGHAVADNYAGLHIERREQRGRAVALLWLPPVVQEFFDLMRV